jgi:membrane-associated protease RseP (regulator of RpoE activity)
MKTKILTRSIAALLLAIPLAHADDPTDPFPGAPKPKPETTTSSSSIVTSADGTATVTIDINGKKETRTFKLGDGAKAGGAAGIGPAGTFTFTGPDKHAQRAKGPWIGIAMEPVQEVVRAQLSLAPGEGIVVNHVAPESPAAKAGLQPNDILLRFEDQILVEPSQLQKLIAMKKPGESVKLTYLRKGERKETGVTLIEHEIEPREGNPGQWPPNGPGGFAFPGMENRLEHLQEHLREMKEKHPGVIVEKRSWLGGSPEQALKGQVEKLKESVKNSAIPKEEAEHIIKDLEHMQRETAEAIERAKHSADEIVKNAQRAVEDASKAIQSRKQHEKEKGDHSEKENPEPKKKPGEPL